MIEFKDLPSELLEHIDTTPANLNDLFKEFGINTIECLCWAVAYDSFTHYIDYELAKELKWFSDDTEFNAKYEALRDSFVFNYLDTSWSEELLEELKEWGNY